MCQTKPGLRCETHLASQRNRLVEAIHEARRVGDKVTEGAATNSLRTVEEEYRLTPAGLRNLPASQREHYAKIRAHRNELAHALRITATKMPSSRSLPGTANQLDDLAKELSVEQAKERALRDTLTKSVNADGYSEPLFMQTREQVVKRTELEHFIQVARMAKDECDRQHVGPDRVAYLVDAFKRAEQQAHTQPLPSLEDMERYTGILEPDSRGKVRSTNVTFASGGSATSGSAAYSASARLFSFLDADVDPDEFVHEYLRVHPFSDGNGRSAWLLRTWLTKSWMSPSSLPHYRF